MNRKIIFGHWDITLVTVNAIILKTVFYFMNLFTAYSATAGFITAICVCILFLLFMIFVNSFYKNRKETDFIKILEAEVGRTGKNIVLSIFIITMIINSSSVLTFFSVSMTNTLLKWTTARLIQTLIMFAALFTALLGLKTVVRTNSFFTPLLLICLGITFVNMAGKGNINNFFPALGYGTGSIFYGILFTFSYFYEIIFLFFLMPNLAKETERKKTVKLVSIISVITVSALTFAYIKAIPFPCNTNILSVIIFISTYIDFKTPAREILAAFSIIYSISLVNYLALNLYYCGFIFSHIFKIKKINPSLISFSLITAGVTALPHTVNDTVYLYKFIQPVLAFTGIIIPLLIFIKGRKHNEKG